LRHQRSAIRRRGHHDESIQPAADGGARRARHSGGCVRQSRNRPSDDDRQLSPARARNPAPERERRVRHGPGARTGNGGSRSHQCEQTAGHTLERRLVFPSCRLVCNDARRPSRYLRSGARSRFRQRAISRTGIPAKPMRFPPWAAQWTSRSRPRTCSS
jgi:hypothetical protein